MKAALLAASAMVIALQASPVLAQDSGTGSAQAIPQTEAQAPETGDTGLQDIVVTAQRRAESAQRAGIAIDVVSGADVVSQGITQPADLNRIIPSLAVQEGGG